MANERPLPRSALRSPRDRRLLRSGLSLGDGPQVAYAPLLLRWVRHIPPDRRRWRTLPRSPLGAWRTTSRVQQLRPTWCGSS